MSKKLYEESSIQDIANAIRNKNGLSDAYKVSEMAAAINGIPAGSPDAVLYTPQTLTDAQKLQARTNIGASDFSGSYGDLKNQPTIPSTQDVADAVIADGIQATLGDLPSASGYTLTNQDKQDIADEVIADGVSATLGDMPSATLPTVLETFIDAFEDGAGNYIPVSTDNNNWDPKKIISTYTGDSSELTGYIPTTDWINGFLTAALAKKLDKTGGTLTGNLTGKYITGTWLQTTAATDLNTTPPKVAVLDASGWVYYRTLDELKTDLGVTSSGSGSTTTASGMKAMESIGGYLGIPTADIPTNGIIYVHISDGGDNTGGDPQMWEGTLKIEAGVVAGGGDNVLNISSTGVTKAGRTAEIDAGIAFYGLTANDYVGVYQVISE